MIYLLIPVYIICFFMMFSFFKVKVPNDFQDMPAQFAFVSIFWPLSIPLFIIGYLFSKLLFIPRFILDFFVKLWMKIL